MKKNTKIYKINGMSCNHCVQAVTNAINAIENVSDVEVDLKSGKATVSGTSLNDSDIINAVRTAGYEAANM